MQDQKPAAVLGGVDGIELNIDAVEMDAGMFAELLIMIAGDINDAGAFFGLVDYPLHNITVQGRPIQTALEFPQVDNIADQIQIITVYVVEKVSQLFGLAAFGAKMSIGNPDRAIVQCHFSPLQSVLMGLKYRWIVTGS
jgi:hypothetical protein